MQILSYSVILGHSDTRHEFARYLKRHHKDALLGYWNAVHNFKQVSQVCTSTRVGSVLVLEYLYLQVLFQVLVLGLKYIFKMVKILVLGLKYICSSTFQVFFKYFSSLYFKLNDLPSIAGA